MVFPVLMLTSFMYNVCKYRRKYYFCMFSVLYDFISPSLEELFIIALHESSKYIEYFQQL